MSRLDSEHARRNAKIAVWLLAMLGLCAAAALLVNCSGDEQGDSAAYDPLAKAYASAGHYENLEAGVPSMCYTKTAGVANPCWTCHTTPVYPNELIDYELQEEYAFSDVALTNHWSNLFTDRTQEIAAIGDDTALEYIRQDNYAPLVQALSGSKVGDEMEFQGKEIAIVEIL